MSRGPEWCSPEAWMEGRYDPAGTRRKMSRESSRRTFWSCVRKSGSGFVTKLLSLGWYCLTSIHKDIGILRRQFLRSRLSS
jgi:hypothetical protein